MRVPRSVSVIHVWKLLVVILTVVVSLFALPTTTITARSSGNVKPPELSQATTSRHGVSGSLDDDKRPVLIRKKRRIALCYVRQSNAPKGKDTLPPQRQIEYIEKYLATDPDLEAIWFSDANGHRSGRTEKGRPQFQQLLEELLTNPDVEKVIVTEFARLARSVFISAKMIELLRARSVDLVFAYRNEVADLNTSAGRMQLHLQSIMDEYYADYVSMMQLIAIATRRVKGLWVGGWPFATVSRNGILKLDRRNGAWLLTDGRLVAGKKNKPPASDAIFHLYSDTLKKTYELYLTTNAGADGIAVQLNREGMPFQSIDGLSCAVSGEHVRTMLAEWPALGGNYLVGRAKDRAGYRELDPETLVLDQKRAVLDLDLVRLVAYKRKARGVEPPDTHGINADAHPLPLAQITRCASCDFIAAYRDDPHRQTRFGGTWKANGQAYYRHRADADCGCKAHSVRKEVIEEKFVALLRSLRPTPGVFARFIRAAEAMDETIREDHLGLKSPEQERLNNLGRLKEKLRRLDGQYRELILNDENAYRKQRAELLEAIKQLEAQQCDEQVIDLLLTEFVALLQKPALLWECLDMPGQRALAHALFECLLYDLDAQEFTVWQLSAWAQALFSVATASSED